MPAVCSISSNKYSALLHKFPDVFKPELRQVPGTQAKHGIHHHITTTGLPTLAKFRRLPPKKLQDAKRAFAEMERMGICKKAYSPWAFPPQHGEETRWFLEALWGLSSAEPSDNTRPLSPPKYAGPNRSPAWGQDIHKNGFAQVLFSGASISRRRSEDSHHHTVRDIYLLVLHLQPQERRGHILVPDGQHLRGHTFLHLVRGRHPDLLQVPEEHLCHVQAVLKRLQANGLVVRFDECTFRVEKADFLGHEVPPTGVRPMASKVDAVKDFQHQKRSSPHRSSSAWSTTTDDSCRTLPTLWNCWQSTKPCSTSFTILTDHKPLVHAFTKAGDTWLARQQQHLAAISEFGCTISYIPSMTNLVANALSRIEINSVHLGIDYEDLAKEQAADPGMAAYHTALTTLKWEDVPIGESGSTLLCFTSTGRPRPLILAS
ncbi:uncharacterized protein [Macrobrachium rosenbergii]|uniref:uncharacterized protein n=1 Tax=Macrobrachium rosenbergii TaxID=79674 RepID=UPI0034D735FF